MYDILSMLELVFEMVNSLEMCVIYCVTIVAMSLLRLRLGVDRSAFEPKIGLTSIEASACCVENSGVLALSLCLDKLIAGRFSEFSHLIESQFYDPTSVQNVFITKLFEPWITYIRRVFNSKFLSGWQQVCCVFNKYLRKYYRGTKKYRYCAKKVVDRCVIYVIS
jgi:hypothetical protein